MKAIIQNIRFWLDLELLFWVFGLLYLAFMDFSTNHFTICPLSNLGFEYCPGCGLGMSIHHLFHLDFAGSWHSHFIGIFGLLVIISRIFVLSRNLISKIKFYSLKNTGGDLC